MMSMMATVGTGSRYSQDFQSQGFSPDILVFISFRNYLQ